MSYLLDEERSNLRSVNIMNGRQLDVLCDVGPFCSGAARAPSVDWDAFEKYYMRIFNGT
jgi:hypothetical protein